MIVQSVGCLPCTWPAHAQSLDPIWVCQKWPLSIKSRINPVYHLVWPKQQLCPLHLIIEMTAIYHMCTDYFLTHTYWYLWTTPSLRFGMEAYFFLSTRDHEMPGIKPASSTCKISIRWAEVSLWFIMDTFDIGWKSISMEKLF